MIQHLIDGKAVDSRERFETLNPKDRDSNRITCRERAEAGVLGGRGALEKGLGDLPLGG